MKKNLFVIIVLSVLFTNCKKEQDPFRISKQSIGLLTDSTQVKDIEAIFSNDSVVKYNDEDKFTGKNNDIEIFDKGGKKLLVLTPNQISDSTAVIENIRIIDSRYKTGKNISTLSTFKEIQENYKISRIDNLINSIVLSLNEVNASITIDKKELPSSLRFNMDITIDATSIPDNAKIKYFMINWQ